MSIVLVYFLGTLRSTGGEDLVFEVFRVCGEKTKLDLVQSAPSRANTID